MILKFNHWSLRLFPKWVDAFAFRDTIYVRGNTLSHKLLRHEQKHLEQYKRYGVAKFLFYYFWYFICYGYETHPFEVEAKENENTLEVIK